MWNTKKTTIARTLLCPCQYLQRLWVAHRVFTLWIVGSTLNRTLNLSKVFLQISFELNVKGTYTCSKSYATFRSSRRETHTGHLPHCYQDEEEFHHEHLYLLKWRSMLNKHLPLSYFKDHIYNTCLCRCLLIIKTIETSRPDQLPDLWSTEVQQGPMKLNV